MAILMREDTKVAEAESLAGLSQNLAMLRALVRQRARSRTASTVRERAVLEAAP